MGTCVPEKTWGCPEQNTDFDVALMCRGEHGLILAHASAAHYASVVGIDEQDLIQNRVQALLAQITEL
jgi:hypothetical protein